MLVRSRSTKARPCYGHRSDPWKTNHDANRPPAVRGPRLPRPSGHSPTSTKVLLGGEKTTSAEEDWVVLTVDGLRLAFQQAGEFAPPTWPTGERPQQFHLDLTVEDVDAVEPRGVGARGKSRRPDPAGRCGRQHVFRVYLDPAGHPFCLCWDLKQQRLRLAQPAPPLTIRGKRSRRTRSGTSARCCSLDRQLTLVGRQGRDQPGGATPANALPGLVGRHPRGASLRCRT